MIYGATLILAAADETGVFGMQIGDGTFVMESAEGAQLPCPRTSG